MTNTEASKILREFAAGKHGLFAWPLDSDYEQHIKFVAHRNERWDGGTKEGWNQFILDYADSLTPGGEICERQREASPPANG